jgi:superfamily II DNA helicase RecQ
MAYAFFRVPSLPEPGATQLLNDFLRSHNVLSLHREWVCAGDASFWAFCVHYQEGTPASGVGATAKVDYKQVLSDTQFQLFCRLRDLRKQIAEREAVPVFAVFTNEQLATMVQGSAKSVIELKAISGIGDAKVNKYGAEVIALLTGHEKSEATL